ncbi:hypothetical protein F443_20509 [Phytophthora nicotianae P1569]|uniref:Uncharacterized protein n=1 Tax=Phytophthora nicotianae P1569 TaxID=1317065 RepID=V9E2G3_PHYNI|nr:hypothetical protein F443_20509 [Phytophthora nicotianae P1569]
MYVDRSSNVALLKTIDISSAPGSEIWGDVGGQALPEVTIAAFKQVDELSQTELGTHLFRLGEDSTMHGVFSELPWILELTADLAECVIRYHWMQPQVEQLYEKLYGRSLEERIRTDMDANYRDLLVIENSE